MTRVRINRELARLACCLFFIFICQKVFALSCEDLAAIDEAEGGGGALLLWSGCERVSGLVLAQRWDDLPEVAQIVFSAKYVIPGKKFPDLSPGSRADELIGSESSLLHKWALAELLTAFSFHALWLDKLSEFSRIHSPPNDNKTLGSLTSDFFQEDEQSLKSAELEYLIKQIGYVQMYQLSAYGLEQELVDAAGPVEPAERIAQNSSLPITDWYLAFLRAKRAIAEGDMPEQLSNLEFSLKKSYPLSVAHKLLLASQLAQLDGPVEQISIINAWSEKILSAGHILSIWAATDHVQAPEEFMLELRDYGFQGGHTWMVMELLELDSTEENKKLIELELEAAVSAGSYEAMPMLANFYGLSGNQEAAAELELQLVTLDVSLSDDEYNAHESLASRISSESWGLWSEDQKRTFLENLYQHCLQTQDDALRYCSSLQPDSVRVPLVRRSAQSLEADLYAAFDSGSDLSIDLSPGRYAAVLIGNNEYSHWDDLRSPMNDIQLIGGILQTKYGFQVKYVRNESRRNVLRAIYEIASELTFDDHLMIYYAGHGVVDPITENAYWIPSEASRDFRPDWISADEILDALKVVPTRHILLVADSCYSGKLLRSGLPAEMALNELVIERLFSKRARVALTSGGDEPVVDSTGNQKNSVFALALSEALSNTGSPTPASMIYKKTFNKVASELSQTPQYDGIRELGHDGGDFVFIPVKND